MSPRLFKSILEQCDVHLSNDPLIPHVLKKEQSLVKRDLEKVLTDDITHDFINGLTEYCEDDDLLKNALTKMSLQKESWNDNLFQDSLLHLLLTIDQIKDSVMNILLEKLPLKLIENDVGFISCALETLSMIPVNNNGEKLAKCLIECMDAVDLPTKTEILYYIPNIIPEKQFYNIVHMLLTLMEEEENLAEPIMKCLVSYNLSNEIKCHAEIFIMDKILTSKRYYRIFPLLFNFLMLNTDNKSVVFENIRLTLDKAMSDNIEDDIKLKIHNKLKCAIVENRQIYDIIFKYTTEEILPIDFYLFMLLYLHDKSKTKQLEVIFKRKINRNLFRRELLEKFFAKYLVEMILSDFHMAIIDLAFSLIDANTMNNSIYGDMGTLLFELVFVHPLCDVRMGKAIIFRVRSYLQGFDPKHHALVLHMLRDISMDGHLCDHVSQIVLLLERRSLFSLRNFKTLFDIVCYNAVKAQAFVDEVQQVITKLLLMLDINIVKNGIIGAVLLAKYLNESVEDDSPATDTEDSPLILAINLLKYTRNICTNKTECMGLFYDELALAIGPKTHRSLLNWLNEDITDSFEKDYVITESEIMEFQLPIKGQFELNAANEVDVSLFINIGQLAQNSQMITRVTVLTPLFRLLRIVNFYMLNGDLNNIDALLGCGVCLPDIEDVEVYGQEDLKIVADSIYHTINWFREIVSAFVNHAANPLRTKVIQRVKHIVDLEDKLDECMTLLMDHELPHCYFYDDPIISYSGDRQSGLPPSKRFKSQSHVTIGNTTTSIGKSRRSTKDKMHSFREIDTDILKLLKYPVISGDLSASQIKCLQSKQFQFIVKDSVCKLYSIICLRQSTESLSHIKPATMLTDCEKLMPYVHKQFRQVSREIATCLENNDFCEESPALFSANITDLKVSVDLVLQFYKHIFTWSGFQENQHNELLKRFLKYFHSAETSTSESLTQSYTQVSITTMLLNMIKNISKYKGQCLMLSSAGNLVKLLCALQALMVRNKKDADVYITATAGEFIQKTWFSLNQTMESGKSAWDNYEVIAKAYLETVNIQDLCDKSETLLKETKMLQAKGDTLSTFRCIDKSSVHVIYTCIFRKLVAGLTQELRHNNNSEQLDIWLATIQTLQYLINIAKFLRTSNVLKVCARQAVVILKTFQNRGLPIIPSLLPQKHIQIQELFTNLESIAKFLHHLCCEAVVKKDASFQIALVRSTLEQVNMKIQQTMEMSNCKNAYWSGILVNKKINGEPIISQPLTESTVTDEDVENSDLCEDDADGNADDASVRSASEVFA